MKPAARASDPCSCLNHGVGKIARPCSTNVLVNGSGQARVGDRIDCVGAPNAISMGAATVLVNNKMAARSTDKAFHPGPGVVSGSRNVLIGGRTATVATPAAVTGLGPDVDSIAALSPTLTMNLLRIQQEGWTISYGKAGGGTYADRANKRIVIDSDAKSFSPGALVGVLAHEAGHARYTVDPEVPVGRRTKDEYVSANTDQHLKDEGEAVFNEVLTRREILAQGGPDIGANPEFEKVADKYPNPEDRDTVRTELGQLYSHYHPSTAPGKTYEQFYSEPYAAHYDSLNSSKKK